ncbi:hypothetical protein AAF712_002865 [Marasmius tenuissimus]|uniref:Phage protein n=1 Tax=Marasmius tenuissimus TaxID=585030 RepID=A0ABR3A8Q0_9AGAR
MTRFEIEQGEIRIAYGSEDLSTSGYTYFLSVVDERLSYGDVEDPSEALTIIESIDASQDGMYFAINTDKHLIGKHVSNDTMIVFMKRYGVPEKHWKLVQQGKEIAK